MKTEHLIIEQDIRNNFSSELDGALAEGFTIVSSNSFWDSTNRCVCYYALLIKNTMRTDDYIPLTLHPDLG